MAEPPSAERDEEALAAIVQILTTSKDLRARISGDQITAATRFKEDLGFDSLALMSLAFELQEQWPELDEMSIATWITVGDCARSLR